jgi:hypothetical protein
MLREKVTGTVYKPWSGAYYSLNAGNYPGALLISSSKYQALVNRVYAGFMAKAKGVSAQLGATLGEYRQSSRMVASRATQLWNFTKRLHKRWKRTKKRRGKYTTYEKEFSDYWLEYSFGWSPLLGTMHSAYKRMCSPPPLFQRVEKSGKIQQEIGYSYPGGTTSKGDYTIRLKMFGTVFIRNPNVALLADLGLLNPAAVAWEITPWSFVADWIFDFSSMINSWSDGFGREFIRTGQSIVQTGSWLYQDDGIGTSVCESVIAQRKAGGSLPQPLPNLALLDNIGSSLRRAANALALTVQLVHSGRRKGAR